MEERYSFPWTFVVFLKTFWFFVRVGVVVDTPHFQKNKNQCRRKWNCFFLFTNGWKEFSFLNGIFKRNYLFKEGNKIKTMLLEKLPGSCCFSLHVPISCLGISWGQENECLKSSSVIKMDKFFKLWKLKKFSIFVQMNLDIFIFATWNFFCFVGKSSVQISKKNLKIFQEFCLTKRILIKSY